jgi:hypothetical protein
MYTKKGVLVYSRSKKMKQIIFTITLITLITSFGFSQKGVDTQTQKITENKTITGNNVNRSFDFGKGKTKEQGRLENPYQLSSKRDVLVETIIDVLESNRLLIDDSASRQKDGIIVTQPFTFSKGTVISKSEINRYAILDQSDSVWTRGRYTLTIEVQSIDGTRNNVNVTAKVEGRTEGVLGVEWTNLRSSGEAENRFLLLLVEAVTGVSASENP